MTSEVCKANGGVHHVQMNPTWKTIGNGLMGLGYWNKRESRVWCGVGGAGGSGSHMALDFMSSSVIAN